MDRRAFDLFRPEQLVYENPAVVSDYSTTHAPVVVLVTDRVATAGEVHLRSEEHFVVPILVTLNAHEASARRHQGAEDIVGHSHRLATAITL